MAEESATAPSPDTPDATPYTGILLRGMLMGAADIVPGVSGGTLAFITGIYYRLIKAITAFDLGLLRLLLAGRWREACKSVDAAFLLVLVSGIAISAFSLARVISGLLESQPLLLWSFFFGLILASAGMLMRHVANWSIAAVLGLLLGALLAAATGLSPMLSLPVAPMSFFLAGFIAICAMILPGISGSFILVLLGMYPAVLVAIETFALGPLVLFATGAGSGLLVFSRFLSYLLREHHGPTLATLTGCLIGSLLVVWPWKYTGADDRRAMPISPQHYADLLGDSQLMLCILLMLAGFLAVWLLESRWGGLER